MWNNQDLVWPQSLCPWQPYRNASESCYGLTFCVLPNWYAEALTCNVWRWDLWELIRLRWAHQGGTRIMELLPLYEEEKTPELPPSTVWGYREKTAVWKPGGEPSWGPKSAGTSVLDFPAPRLRKLITIVSASLSLVFCYSSPRNLRQTTKLLPMESGNCK